MSTIRGVKDRRFKFVQLLNSMFEDQSLSLKAKGFIGYCLTKPTDWKFHVNHLCVALKEGERAIYSTINECEEQGYAIRYQTRKENGDFGEWETLISDSKEEIGTLKEDLKKDPGFQKMFTLRRFADARVADARTVPPTNKDSSNTEKEQQQAAAPIAVVSFEEKGKKELSGNPGQFKVYEELLQVDIPDEEKIELTKRYDRKTVKNAIEWATHPETKINTTLVQAIKWACQKKPEVPRDKISESKSNKEYAQKHDMMKSGIGVVQAYSEEAEVSFMSQCAPISISYSAKGFLEQFRSALRKINITPLPV